MLKTIITIIATMAGVINILLIGFYQGYGTGYEAASALEEQFFISGDNGYSTLSNFHFYIATGLFVFVIGNLIRRHTLSNLICSASVCLLICVYSYWAWMLKVNSELTFITNLQQSTHILDWISIALVLIITVYQIGFVLSYLFSIKPRNRMVMFSFWGA